MAKKKKSKKPIEQYDHKGKKRVNNPPVGLVTPDTDKETGKKTYAYDPHIDPGLQWAGKAEHTSFEVPTDVRVEKIEKGDDKGKYRVEVLGFDYYNTKTGIIESGGNEKIALWMLDIDYDGRSLFPQQVFFPMSGKKDGWSRLAKNLKAEIDQDLIEAYRGTVSLPFEIGDYKRIAVKIVDDRGIESLKIKEID
jgi:hypothetical protein